MESKTIYWASINQDASVDLAPRSLIADLAKSQSEHKGENFIACPAIRSKHRNTFVTTIPYDINVTFTNGLFFANDKSISPRTGLYPNSYAFDWNIQRIFFSKSPQLLEVSPAFLHKTSYSKYGHAPSGAFDICQWFRPSAPTFQLWSGVEKFSAIQNEAHLYFNFPSDEKIILRQFEMTHVLTEIMLASVSLKAHIKKESLPSLYNRFARTGFKKKIMSEIQANLL